jgi:hypothetical protein
MGFVFLHTKLIQRKEKKNIQKKIIYIDIKSRTSDTKKDMYVWEKVKGHLPTNKEIEGDIMPAQDKPNKIRCLLPAKIYKKMRDS